jgi:DNA-binding transcriptional regulator YiaG
MTRYETMTFKDLRKSSGMTQKEFSSYFGIPKPTIEAWDMGTRTPPPYVLDLIYYKLLNEKKITSV